MDAPLLSTTTASNNNFVDLPTDAQLNSCEPDSQPKAQPEEPQPEAKPEASARSQQKESNPPESATVPLAKYRDLKRKFAELQKVSLTFI